MPGDHTPEHAAERRMRELLGDHAEHAPNLAEGLEADAVISRARRRRRPRQLAAGGASALAVIGLLTVALPAVTGSDLFGGDGLMEATTLAETDMSQREEGAPDREAPEATGPGDFACTGAAESHAIDGYSVTLDAHTVTANPNGWLISAEIVIENTGEAATIIDVDAVSVFLDQDGSTVGAYFGGLEGDPVTLAPGDRSIRTLEFAPAPCDPRVALAGEFDVRVAVYLDGELAVSEPVAVTGP